jgi:hypothetical protein
LNQKRKAKDQPGHRASKKKAVEEETVVDVSIRACSRCILYIDIQLRRRCTSESTANGSMYISAIG